LRRRQYQPDCLYAKTALNFVSTDSRDTRDNNADHRSCYLNSSYLLASHDGRSEQNWSATETQEIVKCKTPTNVIEAQTSKQAEKMNSSITLGRKFIRVVHTAELLREQKDDLHAGYYGYWRLTSLNITQMISDNQNMLYYINLDYN